MVRLDGCRSNLDLDHSMWDGYIEEKIFKDVGRCSSVVEALLKRFRSVSEAQNYHIDLVGNIGPRRLMKPPFCEIRPLVAGFKK